MLLCCLIGLKQLQELLKLHVDDAFAKATCSLQITVSPRFLPSRRKEGSICRLRLHVSMMIASSPDHICCDLSVIVSHYNWFWP